MRGASVSNKTIESVLEPFMKELTRKNTVKRYQAYGDKIPTKLALRNHRHRSTGNRLLARDGTSTIAVGKFSYWL